MAAVSLHNWLMSSSPSYSADCPPTPTPGGLLQLEGQLDEPRNLDAQEMRNNIRDFFANEGAVWWQNNAINN